MRVSALEALRHPHGQRGLAGLTMAGSRPCARARAADEVDFTYFAPLHYGSAFTPPKK